MLLLTAIVIYTIMNQHQSSLKDTVKVMLISSAIYYIPIFISLRNLLFIFKISPISCVLLRGNNLKTINNIYITYTNIDKYQLFFLFYYYILLLIDFLILLIIAIFYFYTIKRRDNMLSKTSCL